MARDIARSDVLLFPTVKLVKPGSKASEASRKLLARLVAGNDVVKACCCTSTTSITSFSTTSITIFAIDTTSLIAGDVAGSDGVSLLPRLVVKPVKLVVKLLAHLVAGDVAGSDGVLLLALLLALIALLLA
jgi:hypothetical protein